MTRKLGTTFVAGVVGCFLAACTGSDGKDGPIGPAGAQGAEGDPGAPGSDGATIKRLNVDEYGDIRNWPPSFFGDELEDVARQAEIGMKRRRIG